MQDTFAKNKKNKPHFHHVVELLHTSPQISPFQRLTLTAHQWYMLLFREQWPLTLLFKSTSYNLLDKYHHSYTAKPLFKQSLCCTVTTCMVPTAIMTPMQWLLDSDYIAHMQHWVCTTLGPMYIEIWQLSTCTITTRATTRYPITHCHCAGIKVAQVHSLVAED